MFQLQPVTSGLGVIRTLITKDINLSLSVIRSFVTFGGIRFLCNPYLTYQGSQCKSLLFLDAICFSKVIFVSS